MSYSAVRIVPRRTFSSEAREALWELARRFPVALNYIDDDTGGELVGVVPEGDNRRGIVVAFPVANGFCAADEHLGFLGRFKTPDELCSALTEHLMSILSLHTLH